MADLAAVRAALATALTGIDGLRTYAYIPDSVNVPAAIVGPPAIAFDKAYRRGLDVVRVPLRIYVCRASDRLAQARLDAFFETEPAEARLVDDDEVYFIADGGDFIDLGFTPVSVKTAIEADLSLGGVAHSVRVVSAQGYGAYTIAGIDYMGAEWTVEVIVPGEA